MEFNVFNVGQCFMYHIICDIPYIMKFVNEEYKPHIDSSILKFIYVSGGQVYDFNEMIDEPIESVFKRKDLRNNYDNRLVKEIRHTCRGYQFDLSNGTKSITDDDAEMTISSYAGNDTYNSVCFVSNLITNLNFNQHSLLKGINSAIEFSERLKTLCKTDNSILFVPNLKYNIANEMGGVEQSVEYCDFYTKSMIESNLVKKVVRTDMLIEDMRTQGYTTKELFRDGRHHLRKGIFFYILAYLYWKAVIEQQINITGEEVFLNDKIIDFINSMETKMFNNPDSIQYCPSKYIQDKIRIKKDVVKDIISNADKYIISR